MRSDAVLERLRGLHPRVIDLSLGRVQRLLAALDHPEKRLGAVIHVAGTNGKGSVVAFLRAICEAAGLRVHAYTSPHLVRFAERIRVAGLLPDDDALTALLEECEAANAGETITFFEITTAAALLAFAREPADVTLLEVGLGGRFDATNVVDAPAVTVITPVAVDHQRFLGNTLEGIAFEKAGILKPGIPAIVGPQTPAGLAVIEARAREIGAPVTLWRRDFSAERMAEGLIYREGEHCLALPPPVLAGAHQTANAATAIAAARALRPAPDDAALGRGLARAEWPGRLQRIENGALAARLPVGWELWLDGGHNRHAAEALAAHAAAAWADRPLYAIYGAMAERDPRLFLAPLAPHLQALRCVAIPGEENAAAAEILTVAARDLAIDAAPAAGIAAALEALAAQPGGPARILICGSLYLAGAVLAGDVGP
ncbi:MAG: bifunctional folylpolyglutamate synthase/dihydrofolate synthase [Alphaproteobacteria bacterium]|nr:bifunctional folylpolyglutamate synthase/dihydrofolate synthase [Alphaproteobacteria bacterium]